MLLRLLGLRRHEAVGVYLLLVVMMLVTIRLLKAEVAQDYGEVSSVG